MPVKVVDSSALAALLFGEPAGKRVMEQLRDCSLAAPALLRFEVASVCLKKLRRYPEQRDQLLVAFELSDEMQIAETEVEIFGMIALAEETGLTVYDASYLWLARRLQADLVTLDKKLQKAKKAHLKG